VSPTLQVPVGAGVGAGVGADGFGVGAGVGAGAGDFKQSIVLPRMHLLYDSCAEGQVLPSRQHESPAHLTLLPGQKTL